MTELERLARAYWNAIADEHNQWDALGQDEKDQQYEGMFAAMKELREPSSKMVSACLRADYSSDEHEQTRIDFRAMIDAIIEGK